MISFDARGRLPSLRSFLVIFESYIANTEKLVDANIHAQLQNWAAQIQTLAQSYLEQFNSAQPRILRNQLVLKKMARNFERSLAVIQNEANIGSQYNAQGKSHLSRGGKDPLSFVRVKA